MKPPLERDSQIKDIDYIDCLSTWWPREASSSMICFMLIYCDPPRAMKPAIHADETELTTNASKNSGNNNAIFFFVHDLYHG